MSERLEPVWRALRVSERETARSAAEALPAPWADIGAALIAIDVGEVPLTVEGAAMTWTAALVAAHLDADPADQEAAFSRALQLGRDDATCLYEVGMARGRARHRRRAYAPALADARAARERARHLGDVGREAWALSLAGAALVELRDYARARAVHEAAHALHTSAGQVGGQVASLGGLGLAALGRLETARGAESLQRAVALARTRGLGPEERAWLPCVAHAMTLLDRNDARHDALVRLAELEALADAPLRAAAAWIDAATAATAILALDAAEADLHRADACYASQAHAPGRNDVASRMRSLDALREGLPAKRARWTEAITLRPPPPSSEA